MINIKTGILFTFLFFLTVKAGLLAQETFQPIETGKAPETYEELWANYDPQKEPLDTEILHQWEEDGVIIQVLRYRIGIFKGQKAMMAAIYGYPKGAKKLPGLVQIHGGGQYADYRAVLTNAKRGYATISISWAGRINAPDYKVTPDIVKLFWENKTDDPYYKVTTDWGAVDGYHAPCRNPENAFGSVQPASWTLDQVESPRNNSWFLCAVGARRALTFLEQQPEVDPDKLGLYGHSMGGKLTVLTASDFRVKAAAPSCGGISDNDNDNELYQRTIADDVYLKEITCPTIFLSPANDFHGRINDLQKALVEIESREWRVTCSAHHNHQDNGDAQVTGLLWFDQHLKGTFSFPETPQSAMQLKTKNGVPVFSVTPDNSKQILSVDVFYTQQGHEAEERENSMNRFWHHAYSTNKGGVWTAELPVLSAGKPIWAYANVKYKLDEPITGAGYYYGIYTTDNFNLSSKMHIASSDELKASAVKATMEPSLTIETFDGDWEEEWFTYKPEFWSRKTHKLYNDKWKAPENAKLAFEVRSVEPNKMVVGIDKYATEILLTGGSEWQRIVLSAYDFQNALGEVLPDWTGIMELRLGTKETLREKIDFENKKLDLGAEWEGEKPEFRNLRWIE
jgi:cephalosporin-C deacetylase-like acetyl esterase